MRINRVKSFVTAIPHRCSRVPSVACTNSHTGRRRLCVYQGCIQAYGLCSQPVLVGFISAVAGTAGSAIKATAFLESSYFHVPITDDQTVMHVQTFNRKLTVSKRKPVPIFPGARVRQYETSRNGILFYSRFTIVRSEGGKV